MKILLETQELNFEILLNDTDTAKCIFEKLPITSKASRWGEEVYFEIPLRHEPENATVEVSVGDVAFWPEGSCFCIFFGRTPASIDKRPKPASEVNLIGKLRASTSALSRIKPGQQITLQKA